MGLGSYQNPYLIAEIGVNHGGDLDKAIEMIDYVAEVGWHCAKFQTYKADKLASKHSPAYWDQAKEPTPSQHELFKKFDKFGLAEYLILSEHCKARGVDFLSTAFDLEAVDELDAIMSFFKVASADITNIPLLRKIASKKKPVILSVGAAEVYEIQRAVFELETHGADYVSLLHCVLNYPTPPEYANLAAIATLARLFPGYEIGYSDHVVPDYEMTALQMSIQMGATVIEKHFTYDRSLTGNDHYHAFDREIGHTFMKKLAAMQELAGTGEISTVSQKSAIRNARRSIVAAETIKKGTVLTEANLTTKRPGSGVPSVYWDDVVGKRAAIDIVEDTVLLWGMFDG